MSKINFALMAAAIGAMGGAMTSKSLGESTFSGDCNCKNCKSPTMSSEFCCLTCAVLWKRKQAEVKV